MCHSNSRHLYCKGRRVESEIVVLTFAGVVARDRGLGDALVVVHLAVGGGAQIRSTGSLR